MKETLKILILEDEPHDRDLLIYQLDKAGIKYVAEFTDNGPDFEKALTGFKPDIILSDYNLPTYHGVDAFYTAKKQLPLVPFILVSGTIGEQRAVELIKGGVTDYVIKDALFTLGPVIDRAMKEANERSEKLQAEESLQQTAGRLARAQALAHLGSWEVNLKTNTGVWSDEACRIYGLETTNNLHNYESWFSFIHPDDCDAVSKEVAAHYHAAGNISFGYRIIRPGGQVRYLDSEARFERDETGAPVMMQGIVHDITEQHEAAEKLKQSEARLARAQEVAHLGNWELDLDTNIAFWSDETLRIFGMQPGQNVRMLQDFIALVHPDDLAFVTKKVEERIALHTDSAFEHRIVRKDGTVRFIHNQGIHQFDPTGKKRLMHGIVHDITERIERENKLKESEARLARAQQVAQLGNWELDLDTGVAFWDDETLRICGLTPGQNIHAMPEYIAIIHPDDQAFVGKEIEDSIANGTDSSIEHRLLLPNGTVRYIHNMGTHKPDPTGKKHIMHGIVQDITERKLADLKLQEAEQSLKELFDNTADYIYSVDAGYRLTTCNKAFADNFYSLFNKRPVIGENFIDAIPESIREITSSRYQKAFNGEPVALEEEYRLGDKHQWYSTRYSPIIRNGKTVGIAMFGSNITERKLAEIKLHESEAALKDVFDNTNDYICSVDKELKLVSFNKAFADNFSSVMQKQPAVGDNYLRLMPKDLRADAMNIYQRVLKGETISTERQHTSNGHPFWVASKYNPIIRNGEVTGVAFFASDITERKLAEAKMHESQANLKDVFDNTTDYISSFDTEHRLISFNKAFADNFRQLTKMEPEVGKDYRSLFRDPTGTELDTNYNRLMNGESFRRSDEYIFGGKSYWFSVQHSPIIRNGTVTGFAIFSTDITKQKNAEILLHKSFDELQIANEKQSAILNTLPANIALLDKNGVVIKVNEAWRKFAYENGMKHGNSGLGENYLDVSESAGGPDAGLAHQMAEGLRQVIAGKLEKFSMEYPCHSPTIQRWFRVEVTPLEGYDELGAVVMHLDITDRNKAEEEVKNLNLDLEIKIAERTEQLEKANKEMEAFSYTVSHDLRSPLQVINGYASILERKYKPQLDAGASELLTGIKDGTRQMSQLIADLLNFSHLGRAELKRNIICMKDLVTVVVNELKASTPNFKHTITIHPLKSVTADAGLIHQVWVNLISNAIKYSSNKPYPTIEIGVTRMNNEDVFYVKDNGAGFDMAYYDKLFTVFHRLHKPSEFEGTGVGLALVQSVITRHGGRVWAEAKVNEGATFYFTLPDAG